MIVKVAKGVHTREWTGQDGRQVVLFQQRAQLWMSDDPFDAVNFYIRIDSRADEMPAGDYDLAPGSIVSDDKGRLMIGRVELTPKSESKSSPRAA